MANILVTGGCGFIGSQFIKAMLQEENVFISNLDKLTYAGNPANLKEVEGCSNYRFFKGDIQDREILDYIMKQEHVDMVVNFAAESHVDRSIEGPEIFARTNYLGLQVLLERARQHNISRFLQISTDEVYGEIKKGKFQESHPLCPGNPYSASKAGGDLLALAYYRTYRFPIILTRSCNNYGPYQYPEKFMPRLILRGLMGKNLPVYGDGSNIREWLPVQENCRALREILFRGQKGFIYNIGSGWEHENLEIAGMIAEILGLSPARIELVSDRPGHDFRYALDSSRLKKELDWRPRGSFYQGLVETVKWYGDNRWWWQPLWEERD